MNIDIKTGDIKDISGQVAIGTYIIQIQANERASSKELKELIDDLDQKRQEELNRKISESYSPSTLPEYPLRLREFVTENRVEEINQALIYLQEHRILFISGMGGIGKTTLARALVETRPANVPLPFWFDFRGRRETTLGDVLEKLAGYMKTAALVQFREEGREAEQDDIDKVTDELAKRDLVWLVFDNLETALDDRNFHDPGIDSLFTSLRDSSHQAKVIITSRTLPLLADGGSLLDVLEDEKKELKGLKTDFAVDYLEKNGLDKGERSQLEALANDVDGHPLALQLLIGLVKKFGVKVTLKDLSSFQRHKENTIKKARKLFDKLAGDEKELLERMSVFRQSESIEAIENMFTATTSDDAIENLLDKSLLETDREGNFWLHSLVREFAYDDLENKKEVHEIAMQYYLSIPLPEERTNKEDIQPLLEAHYHACRAEDYNKALNIIIDNNINEDLDMWGNYRTLIDLYLDLLPKDHFSDTSLLDNLQSHGGVLGNLGIAYRNLGQVETAIEYYEKALVIAREIGDRRGEGADLGNLGLAYSNLGQVETAIEYYEQALVIAREIGDRRNEGNWLGNLGNAYSNLGQVETAIEYYEQALVIDREIRDRRGEGADIGNLGLAYSNLGQVETAIEYYEKALVIAREIRDRRGEGADLGNLGLAYSNLGQVETAIEYYEQALVIAREIGDRRGEGADLGNLGNAYSNLGQVETAIEYYEQALVIDREIGNRRGEGADLNNMGFALENKNKYQEALACYLLARDIRIQIKDPNIQTTESNINNLKTTLGKKEFSKLMSEVTSRAEEIVKQMMKT